MTNGITPPMIFEPLNLDTCRADPQWCKKEIVKRLMLLLLEYTRSKPLPFMAHIEPFGPGPTRPPVQPAPEPSIYTIFSNTSEDCYTDQEFYSYAVNALRIMGTWYCSRSFFDFDLSSISSGLSIISATFRFTTDFIFDDTACLQQGTQGIPLTVNDYHAYTGNFRSKTSR